ncbi:MAG: adenylyltransferase/cytidyltransferase family protein [Nitrosopumilaceae archaeon]|nr:adenylyltransferase/cytidyltransferase family protein [Nitrosopumilaceae archaeon]
MKPLEKLIVSAMYISSISGKDPFEIIKEKGGITQELIDSKIDECIKNNLVKEDRKTLTEFGRSSLKVVLAGGVFDIIHPGHIHTLKAAKILGDVLIVVIATDNTADKMKKRRPLHDQEQRKMLVDSLSVVDLSVVGHEGDIFKTVDIIKPQIIALGYDQVHQEKFITEGCRKIKLDVQVARLQSPIPEVSSSIIEKKYGENIHDI